jgi:hypothetical protein
MAKRYGRGKPEEKVRDAIIGRLKGHGWGVKIMHGNAYQSGVPDLYAMHYDYLPPRWIDAKVEGRYSFTKAQKWTWPVWHFKYRVGIWILTDGSEEQYQRLFKPPNWLDYWKPAWGDPKDYLDGPDIDSILDNIEG